MSSLHEDDHIWGSKSSKRFKTPAVQCIVEVQSGSAEWKCRVYSASFKTQLMTQITIAPLIYDTQNMIQTQRFPLI